MTGNPKASPWRATPRDMRKRKPLNVTLSDESLALLDELSTDEQRPRSQVIEDALTCYKSSLSRKSTSA